MSRIVLITTGGTIASRHDPKSGHTVASVGGDDLRRTLHDKLDGIDLVVDEFCNVGRGVGCVLFGGAEVLVLPEAAVAGRSLALVGLGAGGLRRLHVDYYT